MSSFHTSSHAGQFLLVGQERVYLEDLSENARVQMVNIEKTDDEIAHLKKRIEMVTAARQEFAEQLKIILRQEKSLD